jgi:hypothetical protein
VEAGEWTLAMSLSKCRLDPSHDDLCAGLSPQSPHPLPRDNEVDGEVEVKDEVVPVR